MKKLILLLFVLLACASPSYGQGSCSGGGCYDIPNNNADCPGNCRQVPWQTGTDQWNGGVIPTYTAWIWGESAAPAACKTTLTEGNGTTNNGTLIQNCLNALTVDHPAIKLPAGIYYTSVNITVPSNRELQGSGAFNCLQGRFLNDTFHGDTTSGGAMACTTIKLGAAAHVILGSSKPTMAAAKTLTVSSATKGTTQLTVTAHGLVQGDWFSVYENSDPALLPLGNDGCTWCGNDNGLSLIQQYNQVTSVVDANTFNMLRPLYYTYITGQGASIMKVNSWNHTKNGVRDLKVWLSGDNTSTIIDMRGTLYSWIKGVETFDASTSNSQPSGHVFLQMAHGAEIRESYFHHGRSLISGRGYGIFHMMWNSDHKIENNAIRDTRHPLAFEGGGSGEFIGYNYLTDNWQQDDTTFLGQAVGNHGPQPMFNLWEGNYASNVEFDDVAGGSDHIVMFRNWLIAKNDCTSYPCTDGPPSAPNWGFFGYDAAGTIRYHAAVGNVLGNSSWTGSNSALRPTTAGQCGTYNDNGWGVAYDIGCVDYGASYDAAAWNTFLAHGNYDYFTDGVAYWQGGANHTLKESMYYASKPSFFGSCAWPPYGPGTGGAPLTSNLPAKEWYLNSAVCAASGNNVSAAAAVSLQITPLSERLRTLGLGYGKVEVCKH